MLWLGPGLVYLGRAVLGVLLAAMLSVIGIGIAWGMFVFWGAVSHVTLTGCGTNWTRACVSWSNTGTGTTLRESRMGRRRTG